MAAQAYRELPECAVCEFRRGALCVHPGRPANGGEALMVYRARESGRVVLCDGAQVPKDWRHPQAHPPKRPGV
jgi:hypothetical protein